MWRGQCKGVRSGSAGIQRAVFLRVFLRMERNSQLTDFGGGSKQDIEDVLTANCSCRAA